MAVNPVMGNMIFDEARQDTWTFGPVPETGPPELDTGEEILELLARLSWLIPMQQARLQMMDSLPEHERTEQRQWLRALQNAVKQHGMSAGFHQHNLRKAGYSRLTTR